MSRSPDTVEPTVRARALGLVARWRRPASRPPVHCDAHLDGLFTYCLFLLHDHELATAALGNALAIAERRRGRLPDPAERRAWLYALARWCCGRHRRVWSPGAASRADEALDDPRRAPGPAVPVWPEAAGLAPEQREALELGVRHRLRAAELAAVLGIPTGAAQQLIVSAVCEVERARVAAVVAHTSGCPAMAVLDGAPWPPGDPRCRGLVRHVDDCARCRRAAERIAAGTWPGTSRDSGTLPLVTAPGPALRQARAAAARVRGGLPRFDRRGFPVVSAVPRTAGAVRRRRFFVRALPTALLAALVFAPASALERSGDLPPPFTLGPVSGGDQ